MGLADRCGHPSRQGGNHLGDDPPRGAARLSVALGQLWSGPALPEAGRSRRSSPALYFPPMRYKWVFVRRISESSTTAGEAMKPESNLFSASFWNLRPARTTVALPNVLNR